MPSSEKKKRKIDREKGKNKITLTSLQMKKQTHLKVQTEKTLYPSTQVLFSQLVGIMLTHLALANWVRTALAAATMLLRAGLTSAYFRVFKPQSGLTQRT